MCLVRRARDRVMPLQGGETRPDGCSLGRPTGWCSRTSEQGLLGAGAHRRRYVTPRPWSRTRRSFGVADGEAWPRLGRLLFGDACRAKAKSRGLCLRPSSRSGGAAWVKASTARSLWLPGAVGGRYGDAFGSFGFTLDVPPEGRRTEGSTLLASSLRRGSRQTQALPWSFGFPFPSPSGLMGGDWQHREPRWLFGADTRSRPRANGAVSHSIEASVSTRRAMSAPSNDDFAFLAEASWHNALPMS